MFSSLDGAWCHLQVGTGIILVSGPVSGVQSVKERKWTGGYRLAFSVNMDTARTRLHYVDGRSIASAVEKRTQHMKCLEVLNAVGI